MDPTFFQSERHRLKKSEILVLESMRETTVDSQKFGEKKELQKRDPSFHKNDGHLIQTNVCLRFCFVARPCNYNVEVIESQNSPSIFKVPKPTQPKDHEIKVETLFSHYICHPQKLNGWPLAESAKHNSESIPRQGSALVDGTCWNSHIESPDAQIEEQQIHLSFVYRLQALSLRLLIHFGVKWKWSKINGFR